MKSSATIDTRQALRTGTRAAHARVDAMFPNGLATLAAYAVYVLGMHAFVRGVDAQLASARLSPSWRRWASSARAQWLQTDLDALRLTPISPAWGMAAVDATVATAAAGPGVSGTHVGDALAEAGGASADHHDDDARAAGTLYVIEGSALGAQALRIDARRLGFDAAPGALFLERHADRAQARRWPAFVAALDSDDFSDPLRCVRVVHAANAAFQQAEQCFRRAQRACAHAAAGQGAALTNPAWSTR